MNKFLFSILLFLLPGFSFAAFDHSHAQWEALTKKHVVWLAGGHASQVNYGGFKTDRQDLKSYLDGLSVVTQADYDTWKKPQKLAFLINAYNAYTIELILTEYPKVKSIKDLGSLITSPWKKRFFSLLGKQRSLDDVEHGMIRAPGAFNEPRIHMAANCASIGCPALRSEAYVAGKLDAQLEDSVVRFLSDESRNRFNPKTGRLEVSKIFDWYGKDFAARSGSVEAWLAQYGDKLAGEPKYQQMIRDKKAKLDFLDYDWALNDRK
ncbi:MAG TPA: DUF547 domain-containing protein [Burkholderiales bacterium]|nr:DUF547 domain-containing protein [Burkholderiales bacterium]